MLGAFGSTADIYYIMILLEQSLCYLRHGDYFMSAPKDTRAEWINFFGTLICSEPLPTGDDGVLWLEDGDFVWL